MSKNSDHYERVRQFMSLAGQEVRYSPTVPPREERELQARLILEEALETIEALGFYVADKGHLAGDWSPEECDFLEIANIELIPTDAGPQLEGIADGCADLSVVTVGTLIACGIQDNPLLEEVDLNNLRKFGPGSYRREDGKWVKSSNHRPPDIAGVLREQESS